MTTFFVCRHPGAIEWIKQKPFHIDRFVEHLSIESINKGDTVIGILPFTLASQVCKIGATFIALDIEHARNTRGKELSKDCLTNLNCKLKGFEIVETKIPHCFQEKK